MRCRLQSPPFVFIPPSSSTQCTCILFLFHIFLVFSDARSLPQPHKLTRYSYASASIFGERKKGKKKKERREEEEKRKKASLALERKDCESTSCWWFRDVLPSFPWSVYRVNHVYVVMHIAWVWVCIDWVQHHRV